MHRYTILHDDYSDKGPFSWDELKDLADSKKLKLETEVKREDMKKTVSLDYALIFFQEEALMDEQETEKPQSLTKGILGAVLTVIGILLSVSLVRLYYADESISMRQVFIAVIFVAIGAKMAHVHLFPRANDKS
jgi:hypothetical protein